MLHEIDLTRADLNLLVLFDTVMRERHVGRSADALSLSPSAVSHGLARLRVMLNDPLFIKTPRGVTPTDRALALEAPIADILARVRGVVSIAAPFDARTTKRTFTIGAPDGVSAVFLGPLMARLRREAPGVNVRVRQLLPRQGETGSEAAWRDAFAELDARAMDLAVMPIDVAPPRFAMRLLFNEEFVITGRASHAWFKKPTLAAFCNANHLVVSSSGDPKGFVDSVLAERGLERRVALTAPNFMFALALLTETDLLAAIPRRFFELHGKRFKLESAKPPLTFPRFALNMVAPKPAMQDAGLAWLVATLQASV
jgi:DNA-binding transcriptional LysR family regulator